MKSTKRKETEFQRRAEEFLAFAREQAKYAPSWLDLENVLIGIGGKIIELFPERPERSRFMKSKEFEAAMALVEEAQGGDDDTPIEELYAKAERDRRAYHRKMSEPAA
jgi:hypothetical protein